MKKNLLQLHWSQGRHKLVIPHGHPRTYHITHLQISTVVQWHWTSAEDLSLAAPVWHRTRCKGLSFKSRSHRGYQEVQVKPRPYSSLHALAVALGEIIVIVSSEVYAFRDLS